MTPSEKTRLYLDHLGMARGLAWKFHRKYGEPLTTLLPIAESILGLAIAGLEQHYKSVLSSPTTWLYQWVYHEMQDQVRDQKRRIHQVLFFDPDRDVFRREVQPPSFISRLLSLLGEDACILVRTCVEAPREIADDISHYTKGRARRAVRWYLTEKQGWSRGRLEKAWKEVQEGLVSP